MTICVHCTGKENDSYVQKINTLYFKSCRKFYKTKRYVAFFRVRNFFFWFYRNSTFKRFGKPCHNLYYIYDIFFKMIWRKYFFLFVDAMLNLIIKRIIGKYLQFTYHLINAILVSREKPCKPKFTQSKKYV